MLNYKVGFIGSGNMAPVSYTHLADHTQGNETGRMMIVNGFNPGAVFFRTVVNVQANTNYLFTAWILNLFKTTGYPNPQLGVRILDSLGNILYSANLGVLIPVNTNAPEWKQIGTVVNSQANTSLTVEFLSEGPEVIGNDYAIDDVSFNEILIREFTPVKTASTSTASIGEIIDYTCLLYTSGYDGGAEWYKDGRYRWIIKDMDWGFGLMSDQTNDTLSHALNESSSGRRGNGFTSFQSTLIFRRLLENQGFQAGFINRFCDVMNTNYNAGTVAEAISNWKSEIEPAIDEQANRYPCLLYTSSADLRPITFSGPCGIPDIPSRSGPRI